LTERKGAGEGGEGREGREMREELQGKAAAVTTPSSPHPHAIAF